MLIEWDHPFPALVTTSIITNTHVIPFTFNDPDCWEGGQPQYINHKMAMTQIIQIIDLKQKGWNT